MRLFLPLLALLSGCISESAERARVADEIRRAASVCRPLPRADEEAPAPADDPLALSRAFSLAAENSERLASLGEAILRSEIDKGQAIAAALPRVSLRASVLRQEKVPGVPEDTFKDVVLGLRQPLPVPFLTKEYEILSHGLSFATAIAEARRRGAEEAARLLYAETATAFYGVLVADSENKARTETIRLSRERLREVEGRVANGLARKSEALVLKAQIATDEAARARAETDEKSARILLGFLLGRPVPGALADDAPAETLPDKPDAAIEEAFARRSDLKGAGWAVRAADERVGMVEADYRPSLWAFANRYLYRDGYMPTIEDTHWDAGVSLEWPLFEGGATRVRDRQARSERRDAELSASRLKREVDRDVRTAFEQARFAASVLSTVEEGFKAAEENYRAVEGEYRQGLATNLEVLTSLRLLTESRLAFERARIGRKLSGVQFRLVCGGRAPAIPPMPPNPNPEKPPETPP
ncbi:MAG: TolC family protein [Planctomycetota bacterium]